MGDVINVKLKILSAHKLIRRSILKNPDPFAQVFVNEQKLSTTCIEKTVNPVWNETLDLTLTSNKDKIELLIWNNRLFDKRKANAFLGRITLLCHLVGIGERRIELSRSSNYPHKPVRGYVIVELTRIYSVYIPAAPSNSHMAELSKPFNNHIDDIQNCESSHHNKSKDRSVSTSEFHCIIETVNVINNELGLPQGFERKVSEGGKVYFIDTNSGSVHWYHPAVPKYLRKFGDFSCLGPLPYGWDSLQSDSGRTYFIDHVSRTTQYTDPRLIKTLALPDGIKIVTNKLREAGKVVKDQQGCSSVKSERPQSERRKSTTSRAEISHVTTKFSLDPEISSENASHDNPPFIAIVEGSRMNIRSQSSGQIQPPNSMTTFDSQVNISVISENEDPVCENEVAPLPLQRRRISRPTSDYVLNNKNYIEAKLRILRLALKEMMLRKLCIIETSRDNILEESYLALKKLKTTDMHRRLVLKFTDEEGLDYGGVAREWLYLLSETLFSCRHGLFETNSEDNGNLLQVSPLSWVNENHLSYFHFIGRVIGMAIFHGYYIDADFCKIFYKNILNKKVCMDDFKEMDPGIYNSLKWILDNNIDKVNLDLTFSVDQEVFGELTVVDLCENGRCIPVTDNVKHSYIDKYVEYHLMEKCSDQYKHIKKGIYEVLPEKSLSVLNEDEFEVLLTGISEISIEDWKRNTRLKHCVETEPVIKWFWEAVTSFTEQQRTKLLQFVTGSSRIPLSGFEGLRGSYGSDEPKLFTIKVIRNANPQSLPKAHTCFNRLDLPPYSSYKCLHDKLRCAIEETCGFAVM